MSVGGFGWGFEGLTVRDQGWGVWVKGHGLRADGLGCCNHGLVVMVKDFKRRVYSVECGV